MFTSSCFNVAEACVLGLEHMVKRASRVQPSQGDDECRDSTSRNCLSDKGLGAGAGALSLSRLSFGREAGGFAGFRGDACLVLTDGSLQRGQDYGRVSAVGSGVAKGLALSGQAPEAFGS